MATGETVIIKGTKYTVIGTVAIDAEQYPNRAKFISGTVYMKRGNGDTVYSLPMDKNGLIPSTIKPENCGSFSSDDIVRLLSV